MTGTDGRMAAPLIERFLELLREGRSIAAAAREVDISPSTLRDRRRTDPAFDDAWEAIRPSTRVGQRVPGQRRLRGLGRLNHFLVALAETSNISASAAAAGVAVSTVYKLRREDPDFARRWYAALAEGYDNLEMELLGRLRAGGGGVAGEGAGKEKTSFDTAAALRCLAAHRDSVAREKGRRTLAEEATTIASINAKIDRLRLATEAGDAAIAEARRENAARRRKAREEGGSGAA